LDYVEALNKRCRRNVDGAKHSVARRGKYGCGFAIKKYFCGIICGYGNGSPLRSVTKIELFLKSELCVIRG
jgi:hypothetical protein